ncbi:MAG: hypothetical protein ACOYJA_13155 [Christensenellales bacterium]|jgi:hypothetical protein
MDQTILRRVCALGAACALLLPACQPTPVASRYNAGVVSQLQPQAIAVSADPNAPAGRGSAAPDTSVFDPFAPGAHLSTELTNGNQLLVIDADVRAPKLETYYQVEVVPGDLPDEQTRRAVWERLMEGAPMPEALENDPWQQGVTHQTGQEHLEKALFFDPSGSIRAYLDRDYPPMPEDFDFDHFEYGVCHSATNRWDEATFAARTGMDLAALREEAWTLLGRLGQQEGLDQTPAAYCFGRENGVNYYSLSYPVLHRGLPARWGSCSGDEQGGIREYTGERVCLEYEPGGLARLESYRLQEAGGEPVTLLPFDQILAALQEQFIADPPLKVTGRNGDRLTYERLTIGEVYLAYRCEPRLNNEAEPSVPSLTLRPTWYFSYLPQGVDGYHYELRVDAVTGELILDPPT